MPRIQEDAYIAMKHLRCLDTIAKQLEIANKLKALELKGIEHVTPEMVDDVLAGN